MVLSPEGDTMSAGRESFDGRGEPIQLSKVLHRTLVPPYRAKSQEFASISELEIGETITCSPLECSCTRVSSFELSMV